MEDRFFTPFKGSEYDRGISGKKVLVLGASFYCNKDGKNGRPKCMFFDDCTNTGIKDSSKYTNSCPFIYKVEGNPTLKDEPTNSIWSYIPAYTRFANVLLPFIDDKEAHPDYCDYDLVWDRIAFTNYVQFFLPTTKTYYSYLTKRDFNSFCETIQDLQPDIIIAWGVVITEEIRKNNPYVPKEELDRLPENDYYMWKMKLPEVDHEITIVNCYHPSSRKWNEPEQRALFLKYLKKALAK